MCLKEMHVVVLAPHESQHPAQWQQRCCTLHHGFLCAGYHEHKVRTTHRVEKIDRSISQTSALRPKHDKIRTQWALDISSKYDGVNISRWNVEVEPFVAQWIVQMKEDMCELRVVENHMSPWGVDGKGMCYCRLMLRLQEGKDIDEP
jgi:hypothetical protein